MKCPICSSKQSNFVFKAKNIHGHTLYSQQATSYYQCKQCFCLYPLIKVNQSFYQKFYPQRYYQQSSNFLEKVLKKITFSFKNKLIGQPKNLLDIGCGQGDFILQLNKKIVARGIDINPGSHPTLLKGNFLDYKFKQKYDCLTFWHSLEHFPNPQSVINKATKLLKNGGKIVITIPNTNSLAFKLGRQDWFHLDSPRHLFIPNDSNIKLLFPNNFKITIKRSPWEFPLDLFWSLKKQPLLKIFYPIFKIFDRETITVLAQS